MACPEGTVSKVLGKTVQHALLMTINNKVCNSVWSQRPFENLASGAGAVTVEFQGAQAVFLQPRTDEELEHLEHLW